MKANFNFCEARILNLPKDNCQGDEKNGALAYIYDDNKCISMQTDLVGIDEDIMEDQHGLATTKSSGIALIMKGELDTCMAKELKLTVNIFCDKEGKTSFVSQKDTGNVCDIQLTYTSA